MSKEIKEGVAEKETYKASLIAQLAKNPPAMQETLVWFLVGEICRRRERLPTPVFLGFPCGSAGKESACNAGDLGLIPGLGRSPGEGKGSTLQYFCLENSMDYIQRPWGCNELDTTEWFHFELIRWVQFILIGMCVYVCICMCVCLYYVSVLGFGWTTVNKTNTSFLRCLVWLGNEVTQRGALKSALSVHRSTSASPRAGGEF